MLARPPQQEAKLEAELPQHQGPFPRVKSRNKVNMDSNKKEIGKTSQLPQINSDVKIPSISDGPVKATTDTTMEQSAFQDENSGRLSQYRNKKFVNRFSEGVIEPVKSHSKFLSDGKLISGTTRQRKLWRKSTQNDENKLDDILTGKVRKQDITEDERTSARYVRMFKHCAYLYTSCKCHMR